MPRFWRPSEPFLTSVTNQLDVEHLEESRFGYLYSMLCVILIPAERVLPPLDPARPVTSPR